MTAAIRSFPLLVFALAIALLLATDGRWAAFADEGTIKVLDTQEEVNYPAGVNLSVTIEAEAEIAEVRVYYRPIGSGSWAYAYADFNPGYNPSLNSGSTVVATQSIPTRESIYIAPGADIEYYYEIKDTLGNIHRTARATVEYLDQHFNWQRVQIGPLELLYHDIPDSRIDEAERILREDLARVERIFRLEQTTGFKGVIYNSYNDANEAFPIRSQTTTERGTFAGYAFPGQGVFLGYGLDRRIIVHESAHLIFRDAVGNRALNVPDWLNEGFATYMEPDVQVRSSSQLYHRTPHLAAMGNLSGTPESIRLFYQKSVSVVAHLIERYGEENFRQFIKEFAASRSVDTAMVKVYGFDEHGLDASWAGLPIPEPRPQPEQQSRPEQAAQPEDNRTDPNSEGGSGDNLTLQEGGATPQGRSVPQPPSYQPPLSQEEGQNESQGQQSQEPMQPVDPQPPQPREGPSPFLFIDAWLLAGVALLAVAAVGARFVYRRMRSRNEPPEDY